jgi:hypothetical protein
MDKSTTALNATMTLNSGINKYSCIYLIEGVSNLGTTFCNDGSGSNRFVIGSSETGQEYLAIDRDTGIITFNNDTIFNTEVTFTQVNTTGNITADNFFGTFNGLWNNSGLYVPYTGATADVNIGKHNFITNNSVQWLEQTGIQNLFYINPLNGDGFRMEYWYDFELANDDWLIFHKTDGNDANPDGGIGFMMSNSTGYNKTILKLDGYNLANFTDYNIQTRGNATIGGTIFTRANTASSSTAPIQFTAGTLMTTPSIGSLESSTSGLFYTTLGDRRSLMQASQPITATTKVNNTLVETTIYTTTLAANELIAGETIWTHIFGFMSTRAGGGGDTCTIRTYIGNSLITTNILSGKHVTDQPISIEPIITIRSVGMAGTVYGYSKAEISNLGYSSANLATTTINTTAISNIKITIQWDTADVDDTVSIAQGWSTIIW